MFVLLMGPTAWAQQPDEERKLEAKDLANRGYAKFREGAFDEAIALFDQADQLSHSAVIVSFMAQAHEQLGRLIEAKQQYERIDGEVLPDDASDDLVAAQKRARRQVPILARRIPRVRLSISGVSLDVVEVTLDGRLLLKSDLDRALSVNPGDRVLRVQAHGYEPIERRVAAVERQVSNVELVLQTRMIDNGAATATPPLVDNAWVPPAIAFGVGGAGLLLGLVTTVLYFDRAGSLQDRCPDDRCAPELEGEKDAVQTIGVMALVGYGIAIVGAAVGTGFVLSHDDGKNGVVTFDSRGMTLRF